MLSRRLISAASRRVGVVARATGVRSMAKKAEANVMSQADITKAFLEMDATAAAAAASDLPIKLTGRSGALVEQLYGKNKKNFEKASKELESFVGVIASSGLVVDRFFSTTNYSPEECKMVLELLFTNKEPLTSFDSIKSADIKDLVVDNASNLETWKNARKAVQGLNLSEDVKVVIDTLGNEGRLDLVKKAAEKAVELKVVTSKAADAVVTSAVPLTKAQQEAIAKALPNYAPTGTTLTPSFTVDPAVLGGLLISIRNQTIDLSVTSRLVDVVAGSKPQQKMA